MQHIRTCVQALFILLAAGVASQPHTAAAQDLPHPREAFRKILNRPLVMHVARVQRVEHRATQRVLTADDVVGVEDGLLLFEDPNDLKTAIHVNVRMVLFDDPTKARQLFRTLNFPLDNAPHERMAEPRHHGFGDGGQTCRIVESKGTDVETYTNEGSLIKGPYVLTLTVQGRRRNHSPDRLESINIALLRALGDGLTLSGPTPHDASISRVNQPPVIDALRVETPRDEGVLEDDEFIKIIAEVSDPDQDPLDITFHITDAQGDLLYEGKGKSTRAGATLMCPNQTADGQIPLGPLTVKLQVEDEQGDSDQTSISVPIIEPVATIEAWLGSFTITRRHQRLQNVATRNLYEGDVLAISRSEEHLLREPDAELSLNQPGEIMSLVEVYWPKHDLTGRFMMRSSAPDRVGKVIIGDGPPVISDTSSALRAAKDQLFSFVTGKGRDKAIDIFISKLRKIAQKAAGPFFSVVTDPGTSAENIVYVEVNSQFAMLVNEQGGYDLYTFEGEPRILEPDGRIRLPIPAGQWARIGDDGSAAPQGAFDPQSLDRYWERIDRNRLLTHPSLLPGVTSASGQAVNWPLLIGDAIAAAALLISFIALHMLIRAKQDDQPARSSRFASLWSAAFLSGFIAYLVFDICSILICAQRWSQPAIDAAVNALGLSLEALEVHLGAAVVCIVILTVLLGFRFRFHASVILPLIAIGICTSITLIASDVVIFVIYEGQMPIQSAHELIGYVSYIFARCALMPTLTLLLWRLTRR